MNETVLKVLNGVELSTDEYVDVVSLVAAAADGDADSATEVYNTLALIEQAIVEPAVFSAEATGEEIEAPYVIFTEDFKVALDAVNDIIYMTEVDEETGEEEIYETGAEAVIAVTNLVPTAFPTVSLAYLAEALLAYNFDYKIALLEEIVEKRFAIVAIRENDCMFLTEV